PSGHVSTSANPPVSAATAGSSHRECPTSTSQPNGRASLRDSSYDLRNKSAALAMPTSHAADGSAQPTGIDRLQTVGMAMEIAPSMTAYPTLSGLTSR